jgi:adenosylmethionine-8-amino-7-oxononanoate aminotransferase
MSVANNSFVSGLSYQGNAAAAAAAARVVAAAAAATSSSTGTGRDGPLKLQAISEQIETVSDVSGFESSVREDML